MVLAGTAFFVALIVTLVLLRLANSGTFVAADRMTAGPQKFHAVPVPRNGGIGILAGTAAGVAALWAIGGANASKVALLMLCGLPAFAAGLHEDLTAAVSPGRRLVATALSALLAATLANGVIRYTAIPGLDWIVSFPAGALVLTVFAVAGVANAVNIIDGFNGLASMCAALILVSLGYVGFQVGDPLITSMALIGVGAILGFFVWNFPAGLIFLGDGGAYFLGFYLAEMAVLLLYRNPGVSPLFPLLVCLYPIFETVFSIYRKRFLRGISPGIPDAMHLHMLVYRRVMRWAVGNRSAKALTRRNSMTSPYLWALCMVSIVPALVFWDNTIALALSIGVFVLFYVVMYWRIVRFKTPQWLIYRREKPHRG